MHTIKFSTKLSNHDNHCLSVSMHVIDELSISNPISYEIERLFRELRSYLTAGSISHWLSFPRYKSAKKSAILSSFAERSRYIISKSSLWSLIFKNAFWTEVNLRPLKDVIELICLGSFCKLTMIRSESTLVFVLPVRLSPQ